MLKKNYQINSIKKLVIIQIENINKNNQNAKLKWLKKAPTI